MNSNYLIYKSILILVFVFSIATFACKKDELLREPKVETVDITEIQATTATASGNIIDLGEGITDHGHCWSLALNPIIADAKYPLYQLGHRFQ